MKISCTVNYIIMRMFLIVILILFISCADKIDIKDLPISKSLPMSWKHSIPQSSELTGDWIQSFQDSTLNKVFEEFNLNNPDLKTIASRLEMARQLKKMNVAPRFPIASFGFNSSNRQQNLTAFGLSNDFLGGGENQSNNDEVTSFTSNNFGLNLSMQWELDIWRKIFNQSKAAIKDFESLEYDLSYLSFSLHVQLAKLYYSTVEAYQQVNLANETLESINELAEMVSARYDKGLRSSLDVRLTQSSVSSSKALLESRKQIYIAYVRSLEALIGKYPDGSYLVSSDLPMTLPIVQSSMPAEILNRRPDIKSSLAKLEAVSYRKAASISTFFPGVVLTSSIGTSSDELKDILNEDYQIWSQGVNIALPLFQGGSLIANKKMQDEAQKISEQELIKTILNAFSEVEQSLFLEYSNNVLLNSYSEAADQAEAAYKLSRERYDSGLVDLIAVLDSQQRWFQARSQVLNAKKTKIDTRLNLILALGGEL